MAEKQDLLIKEVGEHWNRYYFGSKIGAMASTRQEKVARLLHKELGDYFQKHGSEFLAGKMITVTVVRITPDLGIARAYLSICPVKEGEEPIETIREQTGKVRLAIGNRIRNQVKSIPEFQFFLDDSLDYIERIDNLLNE